MRTSRILLALLFPILSGVSYASNEAAANRLKSSVDQVLAITKNSPTRDSLITSVKPVLEKILNFEIMTRRAIGPGWRQFTPEQQHEAVRLFTTLILRTYTAKFTPGELPAVEYKTSISLSDGRVEIPTTSVYKGSRYDVIYRMDEQNGSWGITDVVIEGVSLVANYRTQFDSEFKRGGTEAVLGGLRRSVAQTKRKGYRECVTPPCLTLHTGFRHGLQSCFTFWEQHSWAVSMPMRPRILKPLPAQLMHPSPSQKTPEKTYHARLREKQYPPRMMIWTVTGRRHISLIP